MMIPTTHRPSAAFVGASWMALIAGMATYFIGLWRSDMQLNEKGYYFAVIMYGLFAAISVQKAVRDRLMNIAVTNLYYGLAWISLLIAIGLLCIGLINAQLGSSEKGFYAMSFGLSLFAAIAVQKNTRDSAD
ncbi:MAG TPA: inner membrane protein YiaA [Luteibacter sp.]|uniref:inner membrane protein YiaA n=1 Tax=Luteibacter sp. TaxID=1886636 RepID=UPI002BAE2965|nr:inner membrane protein YiaA [Luteibacter sp.]HVI55672.1 inner membrane protein YiaA [Luteibacter sp.]